MSWELVLAIVGCIGSVIIPFILYGMRNQNGRVEKLEERIYKMSSNHVTKDELKDELRHLEDRVSQTVKDKFELVNESIKSIKELLLSRIDKL